MLVEACVLFDVSVAAAASGAAPLCAATCANTARQRACRPHFGLARTRKASGPRLAGTWYGTYDVRWMYAVARASQCASLRGRRSGAFASRPGQRKYARGSKGLSTPLR